jgi:CHAT domain-containing protein
VAALQREHPGATVLAPPASTSEAVVALLQDSGLAHLACHGSVRADNPLFSSLVLSDGPLSVHELTLRGGTPSRVVLASCESGVQRSVPGDEALGFVSALLARGAAGVVASGVLVPDAGAVPLMRAVHARLAQGDPLWRALHAARCGTDRESPEGLAAWCAFDAYGAG